MHDKWEWSKLRDDDPGLVTRISINFDDILKSALEDIRDETEALREHFVPRVLVMPLHGAYAPAQAVAWSAAVHPAAGLWSDNVLRPHASRIAERTRTTTASLLEHWYAVGDLCVHGDLGPDNLIILDHEVACLAAASSGLVIIQRVRHRHRHFERFRLLFAALEPADDAAEPDAEGTCDVPPDDAPPPNGPPCPLPRETRAGPAADPDDHHPAGNHPAEVVA
jgi:hypothetical protein